MKVFDSHTHIFPVKISEKATAGIAGFYDLAVRFKGNIPDLTRRLNENNICGCLVCSVATIAEQVCAINDFISQSVRENPQFVGFCSLHPDMSAEEINSEIDRSIANGLKGIKLHPDFQQFEANGKKAFAIYEIVGDRLPILIHAGDKRYNYSSPRQIREALDRFPNVTFIAAHLGGWSEWDDAVLLLTGHENLYVDSSSSLYELTAEKATEYINAFGADKVLFGSDYPMWDVKEELRLFERLSLTDADREKILYNNARDLFGLAEVSSF